MDESISLTKGWGPDESVRHDKVLFPNRFGIALAVHTDFCDNLDAIPFDQGTDFFLKRRKK